MLGELEIELDTLELGDELILEDIELDGELDILDDIELLGLIELEILLLGLELNELEILDDKDLDGELDILELRDELIELEVDPAAV